MVDFPILLVWTCFVVAAWLAVVQLCRDRTQLRFKLKFQRLHDAVAPFAEGDVERHGNRVFVDKLVAKRLVAKRLYPTKSC